MGLAEFEGEGVKCPTPLKVQVGDFSGGLVAKTLSSQCRGHRFDPWSGNYIPHATTKTQFSQINNYFKKSLVSLGKEHLNFTGPKKFQRYWISKSGEAQILLPYPILQIFIIFHKTFTGICLVKEELAH